VAETVGSLVWQAELGVGDPQMVTVTGYNVLAVL